MQQEEAQAQSLGVYSPPLRLFGLVVDHDETSVTVHYDTPIEAEFDLVVLSVDDGTYTIPCGEEGMPPWRVSGSDEDGWIAEHPDDGFYDTDGFGSRNVWRFATKEDAFHAVFDDPAEANRWSAD